MYVFSDADLYKQICFKIIFDLHISEQHCFSKYLIHNATKHWKKELAVCNDMSGGEFFVSPYEFELVSDALHK